MSYVFEIVQMGNNPEQFYLYSPDVVNKTPLSGLHWSSYFLFIKHRK